MMKDTQMKVLKIGYMVKTIYRPIQISKIYD